MDINGFHLFLFTENSLIKSYLRFDLISYNNLIINRFGLTSQNNNKNILLISSTHKIRDANCLITS